MQSSLINSWSLAHTFIDEKLLLKLQAYDNNELLELTKENQNKELIKKPLINSLDQLFNIGLQKKRGGCYNHTLFFENLAQNITLPDSNLQKAINNAFGSLENLKIELKRKAMSILGSGWCFLALDIYHNLVIVNYSLHQNELKDDLYPLLAIDVWEDNYYHYINRGQYLNALLNIIDWKIVSNHYNNYISTLFHKS